MDDLQYIKKQLEGFIRRYYLNELLKGAILFFSIWLLYFISILLIEHFFWLSPPGRSILFWTCIVVSMGLLFKFVIIPLARLFRISKGIDEFEASRIIGKHFPQVNDKLLNILQLQKNPHQSDLLLAGIAQKSRELKPVPFKMAVDFRTSLRYLKYAAFPFLIILAIIFTGNSSVLTESYNRVVHYNIPYEPPAPFSFNINNNILEVEEGKSLTLEIETQGSVIPETAGIHFDNEMYYLRNGDPGKFLYTFQGLKDDQDFYLRANGVNSRKYSIKVIKVPKLLNFEVGLEYPAYLRKQAETVKGTGNIAVPEGTSVSWNLNTQATDEVIFTTRDTVRKFSRLGDNFSFSQRVRYNLQYQIKTSNSEVKDHETLDYKVEVIRDQYPEIQVEQKMDTVREENRYFFGKISDDYSISRLNLVYFTGNDEENATRIQIPVDRDVFAEFFYTFPDNLELEKGSDYSIYFEVYDNDGVNGAKRSKSEVFGYRKKSVAEIKEDQLKKQGESIQSISQTLENMQLSERELEELSRLQKEKEQLNFNDRKKLDNFLERQRLQNQIMKNYTEKLKQGLEKQSPENENAFQDEMEEMLDRNEERLEENEQLLEELQEYSDKISREELSEKLEKLSKQNTNEQKNLEQMLELTKRYYVQEKTQKLASELSKLAEDQEKITEEDSTNTEETQDELNEEFERFQDQMDELEKENQGLKKPYELGREKEEETEIKKQQQDAGENLQQDKKEDAKKDQKGASEKMKEMSRKMQSMQMMSQGEQLNANIESLRQILDNLMTFSFEQEDLLLRFRELRANHPGYAKELKKQQVLKEHFQHIDDSLFALAVNNPMITEKITSRLTDIEFDINKSLERLAQNELPQGTASQQYVMTATNDLALMLNTVMDNMQEMASGASSGGDGGGMQLQDIIMTQEELNKKMSEGLQEGEGKEPKPGEEGKAGDGDDGEREGEGDPGNKENGRNNGEGEEKAGEELSGKLFEIFKQQQILKQQLENKLKELGIDKNQTNLLRQMEQVEKDILEKGFNEQTLKRMNNISHHLLELENAALEQEEEQKRTSRTNRETFENNVQDQNLKAKEYFRTTEILNRQTLPLHQNYKAKVKRYFGPTEN